MINPLTLNGQLVGAVVQGLGGAFMEQLSYDQQGQLLTGSLSDYLIPTATDFPKIRGLVMKSSSPINRLGAKGAGSLGVEPRDLPLSPSRVWQLVQDARGHAERPRQE